MKDAKQYNREMKLSNIRYRTIYKTDKKTGFRYKVVQTVATSRR